MDKKTKPVAVLYPENPSHMQGYTKAQNKGMKIYQANGEQKKAGVAILISDKIDFKATKLLARSRILLHPCQRSLSFTVNVLPAVETTPVR